MTDTYDRFADAKASSNSSFLPHDVMKINTRLYASCDLLQPWQRNRDNLSPNMQHFLKRIPGPLDPSMASTPVCAVCLEAVVPVRMKRPVNPKYVCWPHVLPRK